MSSELFKHFSQPTTNIHRLVSILDKKIINMLTLHTTPNKGPGRKPYHYWKER